MLHSNKSQSFVYFFFSFRDLFNINYVFRLCKCRLLLFIFIRLLMTISIAQRRPFTIIFFDMFSFCCQFWLIFFFILYILLLLIPPPFVYLRLRQTCNLWHLSNFFLAPIRLNIQLIFEHLDLNSTFSFSFLDSILILLIIIVIKHIGIMFGVVIFHEKFIQDLIAILF